jgi:hypothetical protein
MQVDEPFDERRHLKMEGTTASFRLPLESRALKHLFKVLSRLSSRRRYESREMRNQRPTIDYSKSTSEREVLKNNNKS